MVQQWRGVSGVPESLVSFTGVPEENVISGGITVTHGTEPWIATIYCAPFNPTSIPLTGTFRMAHGGQSVQFPDCRLADVAFQTGADGRQRMVISVETRQWRWKRFGWIRGDYNVREKDDTIRKSTEKKPQELASLCFQAMGERKFDVSALPQDARPRAEWDQVPSEALNRLCEELGCRVVLDPATDRAKVVRVGVGNNLPGGVNVTADSIEASAPAIPAEMVFLGGQSLWQVDILLEAVMPEEDGEWKLLDDVSYTPEDGWQLEDSAYFENVAKQHRKRAKQHAWRAYRVTTNFTVPDARTEKGKKFKISNIDQILPLTNRQLETREVAGRKTKTPLEPWVYGVFDSGDLELSEDDESIVKGPNNPDKVVGAKETYARWTRGMSLDAELGIVLLSQPAYRYPFARAGIYRKFPGIMYLRVAVGLRDPDTHAFHRFPFTVRPRGRNRLTGPPMYVVRNDIAATQYRTYGRNSRIINNYREYEQEAKFYLDQTLRQFQLSTPGSRTYAGFQQATLDGAIQQISWQLDDAGFFRTMMSRNREMITPAPTYAESRERQRNRELYRENKGGRVEFRGQSTSVV